MKIVVLDGYALNPGDNPWAELEKLGEIEVYERSTPEEIRQRSAGADVLLTNKAPLPAALLESLPRLKLISVLATGYNVVDVAAARRQGITVCNVPDYGTNTVAQYVMALLLELCHHVGKHAQAVSSGEWTTSPDWTFWHTPQMELYGRTMGVVGFGRIGRRIAELAEAFGMRVIYNSRKAYADVPQDYRSIEDLFAEADVVSLHCGLTPENTGMVNAALLKQMKPSALLINTARGGLIDEHDMAAALEQGTLAGAAVDVLSSEPPAQENPLLRAKNCLVTPHMAWAALEARQRIMQTTVKNVQAFATGTPINVVS